MKKPWPRLLIRIEQPQRRSSGNSTDFDQKETTHHLSHHRAGSRSWGSCGVEIDVDDFRYVIVLYNLYSKLETYVQKCNSSWADFTVCAYHTKILQAWPLTLGDWTTVIWWHIRLEQCFLNVEVAAITSLWALATKAHPESKEFLSQRARHCNQLSPVHSLSETTRTWISHSNNWSRFFTSRRGRRRWEWTSLSGLDLQDLIIISTSGVSRRPLWRVYTSPSHHHCMLMSQVRLISSSFKLRAIIF